VSTHEGVARTEGWSAGTILLFAVWLGLTVGVLETAAQLARQHLGGAIIHRPRELVWMGPLGYTVLFGLPGLAAASLVRIFRGRIVTTVALALLLLAAFGALALFPFFRRVHLAALALLAVGAAARLAPWLSRRPAAARRLARLTVPPLAGLVVLAGAGVAAGRAWTERATLDRLPDPAPGSPNVLLLILDTVAAMHTSVHGYGRPTTPVLERFASEGVAFDHALSTSPWTLPSHATMFTGLYPHELAASWLVPFETEPRTLAEEFGERGYATAGFVANRPYGTYEHGLDRGFARYEDYRVSPGQVVRSTVLGRFVADVRRLRAWIGTDRELGGTDARMLTDRFLGWLDDAPDRPFFAFLNYYDAHDPYLPPDEHFARFAGRPRGSRTSPIRRYAQGRLAAEITADEVREEVDAYDGAISSIDEQIGRLLGGLRERGMLDGTIVVVTSDHGEEFGEHGLFLHGHSLYLPSLHVPLVIRYPGHVPAGERFDEPVTLRDLAATVADLASMCDADFPGRSLALHWGDPGCGTADASPLLASVRQGVRLPASFPAARGDMYSSFDASMRYILNGDGQEEVYRWRADPLETEDLEGTAEGAAAIARLRPVLPPEARSGTHGPDR